MDDRGALESFREGEAELTREADARIVAQVGRLARAHPDAAGRTPFRDVLGAAPVHLSRSRWTDRRLVGLVALAVLVGLLGAVLVVRASDLGRTTPGDLFDLPLPGIADRAATRDDRPLEPGWRLHHVRREASATDQSAAGAVRVDWWLPSEGWAVSQISASDGGSGGSETWTEPVEHAVEGIELFGYPALRALPEDPEGLRAELDAALQTDAHVEGDLVGATARLLMIGVVPPEVRAAGLDLLAGLGGRAAGTVEDSLGRPGVGISLDEGGRRSLVIVDPDTTMVLEVRSGPPGEPPDQFVVVLEDQHVL